MTFQTFLLILCSEHIFQKHSFNEMAVVLKSFYSITGQSPGAFLYSVSRPGGQDHIPYPSERWEDFWKHVWARAEAQHHLAVILRPGAAGAVSPSGPRQALPSHHAAHGHCWTDWYVSDRKYLIISFVLHSLERQKTHVFSIEVHLMYWFLHTV